MCVDWINKVTELKLFDCFLISDIDQGLIIDQQLEEDVENLLI